MNSPSREEIDARFAAVDVRIDGSVAAIRASIEGLVVRMDERDKRTDERMTRLERLYEQTVAAISDLKKTTIVTGISAVIAIVLGVGATNAALLSNTIAAFQAGSAIGATQAEIKRQVDDTGALLKQLQAAQGRSAAPAQPAPGASRQP